SFDPGRRRGPRDSTHYPPRILDTRSLEGPLSPRSTKSPPEARPLLHKRDWIRRCTMVTTNRGGQNRQSASAPYQGDQMPYRMPRGAERGSRVGLHIAEVLAVVLAVV